MRKRKRENRKMRRRKNKMRKRRKQEKIRSRKNTMRRRIKNKKSRKKGKMITTESVRLHELLFIQERDNTKLTYEAPKVKQRDGSNSSLEAQSGDSRKLQCGKRNSNVKQLQQRETRKLISHYCNTSFSVSVYLPRSLSFTHHHTTQSPFPSSPQTFPLQHPSNSYFPSSSPHILPNISHHPTTISAASSFPNLTPLASSLSPLIFLNRTSLPLPPEPPPQPYHFNHPSSPSFPLPQHSKTIMHSPTHPSIIPPLRSLLYCVSNIEQHRTVVEFNPLPQVLITVFSLFTLCCYKRLRLLLRQPPFVIGMST